MIAITLTLEAAEEFFRRVLLLKNDTEQERVKILLAMAKEGLIENIIETERTKDEYVKDQRRHFNVLDLTEAAFPDQEDEDEEIDD